MSLLKTDYQQPSLFTYAIRNLRFAIDMAILAGGFFLFLLDEIRLLLNWKRSIVVIIASITYLTLIGVI